MGEECHDSLPWIDYVMGYKVVAYKELGMKCKDNTKKVKHGNIILNCPLFLDLHVR
jgi:hypothetical protein